MLAPDLFWRELLCRIEPTKSQKNQAKINHEALRTTLDTGHMARRISTSYLSGSYARHTAIRPQDDVDIIFILDQAQWQERWFSRYPHPVSVLDSFARAIRYRYPDNRVVTQRRSIRLELEDICIDVVPAVPDDEDPDLIMVPNIDDDDVLADDWIPSRPRRHARIVNDLNSKNRDLFVPLVKILKYWNSQMAETRQFKSFAVETLAATALQGRVIDCYETGLLHVLDFVALTAGQNTIYEWDGHHGVHLDVDTLWSLRIPDLGGSGSNLAARMKNERCNAFVSEAIRARDRIQQGLNQPTLDAAVDLIRTALRTSY